MTTRSDTELLRTALVILCRALPAHRYRDEQELIDEIRARLYGNERPNTDNN